MPVLAASGGQEVENGPGRAYLIDSTPAIVIKLRMGRIAVQNAFGCLLEDKHG
jgi:hypothetical protein